MTNTERKQIVQNALIDYATAKQSGDGAKIARAISDMENVYICVRLWAVEGTETLRQTILDAKGLKN